MKSQHFEYEEKKFTFISNKVGWEKKTNTYYAQSNIGLITDKSAWQKPIDMHVGGRIQNSGEHSHCPDWDWQNILDKL